MTAIAILKERVLPKRMCLRRNYRPSPVLVPRARAAMKTNEDQDQSRSDQPQLRAGESDQRGDDRGDLYQVGNYYHATIMSRSLKCSIGVTVGACTGPSTTLAQLIVDLLNRHGYHGKPPLSEAGSPTQSASAENEMDQCGPPVPEPER